MSGVTHATIAVAVLFGEQENTEQVNCIVSSMRQACPRYPQLLTYRRGQQRGLITS
jgi:protein involved in sex pheromone biosynthesis